MAKRTLLVIGSGIESIPGLQRARQMGLHIIATDGNPDAPGFACADEQLIVSTYDAASTLAAVQARGGSIDGVIALAADVPLTVASVAHRLGLPGPRLETARLTSDKLAMKEHLAKAGVPIPWYVSLKDVEHLRLLHAACRWPLVLKPVDSRGARGVLRLTQDVDLSWAYAYSKQFSPTGRVMVEEYLAGPQISTESVLCDGWVRTPGFIDRNYANLDDYAPHMIEDGGQQPTVLSPHAHDAVCRVAERAARALGIDAWTAKGDIVLTRHGPKVIEMASRLSGGWMSSVQVPLATGVDLIGAAIKLALGESVSQDEVTPHTHHGVAIRYLFPPPGCVVRISGVEEARVLPGVHAVKLFTSVDEIIHPVTNHTQRAGCVIATGTTRDEAVSQAEAAVRMIRIETEAV